jgi:hypothetical protein
MPKIQTRLAIAGAVVALGMAACTANRGVRELLRM